MSGPKIDFLDDALPDDVTEAETEVATPVAETVATPEPPAPEAPTAPETQEERVPLAALRAEREKRQAEQEARKRLERELAELRQPIQPEPVANFYEAPDQYVQQIEHRATQRLYAALEETARETYPDYDEVFAEVQEAAASNPAIAPQVFNAANPAMAAYKLGKQLREMKQMQDPDAYRERVRAELRAEIEAEQKAATEARAKAANAIPPDLTAARSAKGTFLPASESVFKEIF